MNSLLIKTLPLCLCLCLFVFSAQAQTSTPSPVYRSEPSDTNYRPTDEDAYRHVHESVTIIDKKRLMPDGSYKTEKAYIHHRKTKEGNAISDTTAKAEAAVQDTSATDAAVAPTVPVIIDMPSDTDTSKPAGNRELLFGALSLIVLALLLALFLVLGRDKKRPTPISVIQAVSMALGLSILLAYCICLSAFVCGAIVLLIAAMTGAAVLTNDLNERQNPTWLVGTHILLTIIGIVIIVMAAFIH